MAVESDGDVLDMSCSAVQLTTREGSICTGPEAAQPALLAWQDELLWDDLTACLRMEAQVLFTPLTAAFRRPQELMPANLWTSRSTCMAGIKQSCCIPSACHGAARLHQEEQLPRSSGARAAASPDTPSFSAGAAQRQCFRYLQSGWPPLYSWKPHCPSYISAILA